MHTNHHVQHHQVQADLVVELVNLEVWEDPCFLEGGQVQDVLKNRTTPFALCVDCPESRQDCVSDGSNDGSSIPVVAIPEPRECAGTFDGGFWSGVAIGFQERSDQGVEGLKLVQAGELFLDGVEYGSGFLIHETVSF